MRKNGIYARMRYTRENVSRKSADIPVALPVRHLSTRVYRSQIHFESIVVIIASVVHVSRNGGNDESVAPKRVTVVRSSVPAIKKSVGAQLVEVLQETVDAQLVEVFQETVDAQLVEVFQESVDEAERHVLKSYYFYASSIVFNIDIVKWTNSSD